MKKLMIIGMLLISTLSFAQKTEIDSIKIFNPDSIGVRKVIKDVSKLRVVLDSLSVAEKQNTYKIVYYLKDDKVVQCTVKKVIKKD